VNAPSDSSGALAGVTVVELAGLGPVLHGATLPADTRAVPADLGAGGARLDDLAGRGVLAGEGR
jgi:hypothetical protein